MQSEMWGEEGTQHYPPTPKDPHQCIFVSDITLLGVPTNDFSRVASEETLTHCVKTSHLLLGGCLIMAGEGHQLVIKHMWVPQFILSQLILMMPIINLILS